MRVECKCPPPCFQLTLKKLQFLYFIGMSSFLVITTKKNFWNDPQKGQFFCVCEGSSVGWSCGLCRCSLGAVVAFPGAGRPESPFREPHRRCTSMPPPFSLIPEATLSPRRRLATVEGTSANGSGINRHLTSGFKGPIYGNLGCSALEKGKCRTCLWEYKKQN